VGFNNDKMVERAFGHLRLTVVKKRTEREKKYQAMKYYY